jgi:DNA (cytosine-5)-methyltransferase 1
MTVTADDLFCGAGGSGLGFEMAGGRLLLGINHWDRAVETHATNFQHADHDCADISALTTAQIRRYITGSDLLIAGTECVVVSTSDRLQAPFDDLCLDVLDRATAEKKGGHG